MTTDVVLDPDGVRSALEAGGMRCTPQGIVVHEFLGRCNHPTDVNHYHFRCHRTGHVQDLATSFYPDPVARVDPGLSEQLERQGMRVSGYWLELVGSVDDTPGLCRVPATQAPGGAAGGG